MNVFTSIQYNILHGMARSNGNVRKKRKRKKKTERIRKVWLIYLHLVAHTIVAMKMILYSTVYSTTFSVPIFFLSKVKKKWNDACRMDGGRF